MGSLPRLFIITVLLSCCKYFTNALLFTAKCYTVYMYGVVWDTPPRRQQDGSLQDVWGRIYIPRRMAIETIDLDQMRQLYSNAKQQQQQPAIAA